MILCINIQRKMTLEEEIIQFLKDKGYRVTEEIRDSVERLEEMTVAAQNKDDVTDVLRWLEEERKKYPAKVSEVGINELDKWHVDPKNGWIAHESGRFFQIVGIRVEGAGNREVTSWTQPMMKQNECGILGVICKKINGVRHYLLNAKFEPGNNPNLQLSPALQATESNLKLVHGGKKPPLAEYFEGGENGKVVYSAVGVEDGGRFYLKTNRSVLVEVDENEDVKTPEGFIWLTLPQIKKLLRMDNVVNSLAREVFALL